MRLALHAFTTSSLSQIHSDCPPTLLCALQLGVVIQSSGGLGSSPLASPISTPLSSFAPVQAPDLSKPDVSLASLWDLCAKAYRISLEPQQSVVSPAGATTSSQSGASLTPLKGAPAPSQSTSSFTPLKGPSPAHATASTSSQQVQPGVHWLAARVWPSTKVPRGQVCFGPHPWGRTHLVHAKGLRFGHSTCLSAEFASMSVWGYSLKHSTHSATS